MVSFSRFCCGISRDAQPRWRAWQGIALAVSLVSLLALNQGAAAQAQQAPPPEGAQAESEAGPKMQHFQEVYGQWLELLEEMRQMRVDYPNAGAVEKAQLRQQYEELTQQAEDMMPKLTQAAEEAFTESPSQQGDAAQFLSETCNYLADTGKFERTLQLTKKLLDHNVQFAHIYVAAAKATYALARFEECEKYVKTVRDAGLRSEEIDFFAKHLDFYKQAWEREQELRQMETEKDNLPRVVLKTEKGDIVVELFEDNAPNTVANFVSLVEQGFYDGTPFHRVLPGFVAQGGDPTGEGMGGPGYHIADEYDRPDARVHFRGSLSMANTGQPDTNGSQFFITFQPARHLDGKHTVFGRVIEGMDVVNELQPRNPEEASPPQPDRIVEAEVLRKRPHEYTVEKIPN